MKNVLKYGYNYKLELLHQKKEDYLVGSVIIPPLFFIPIEWRGAYLPDGELQNIGEEKMDCATRAPINKLEIDFTYGVKNHLFSKENEQWLYDNGYVINGKVEFSDVFIAILSNTTEEGNSLIAPLDAIKKYGLIPKKLLTQLQGFEENYNKDRITKFLRNLGNDFKNRFKIRYERATEDQFKDVLLKDSICTGGFAWSEPINGEYPRVPKLPNHAFMVFKPEYYIFDNYIDSVDGDFIKKLTPDYDFMNIGYRVYIYKENVIYFNRQENSLKEWMRRQIDIIKEFINSYSNKQYAK